MMQPLWKSLSVVKQDYHVTTTILFLNCIPKRIENKYSSTGTHMFIAKRWKQTKYSSMDKEIVIYTHNGIISSCEVMIQATKLMNLQNILIQRIHTQKMTCDFVYMKYSE